jgi:hypothetical protein
MARIPEHEIVPVYVLSSISNSLSSGTSMDTGSDVSFTDSHTPPTWGRLDPDRPATSPDFFSS